ncbi:hypothetical protein DV738_g2816, partial [Chaetothyriales sp. CBS 135597]
MADDSVPEPGHWPVPPQHDVTISESRLWVDGCFDFAHHGHAGALLQARQLGTELWVGLHTDESILENKGPTVMTLDERVAATEACRWVTKAVPGAPYVTSLPWISHYGCWYVVHGDDITSDANGEDCYRFVKQAGRMKIVARTPGISTTDLVGRMLLCTKTHFIRSLPAVLSGDERAPDTRDGVSTGKEMLHRITNYSLDETGLNPGCNTDAGTFTKIVSGIDPRPGQRVVYVDGGFDLFSSGQIEFLRRVNEAEAGEAYIVAGVHDDNVINQWKGLNYPIMNIYERGLCVLQCRYINAVVFSAPFAPSRAFLNALPLPSIQAVYHGPTSFIPLTFDPYADAKAMGIFRQVGEHRYAHVNAGDIVMRIIRGRNAFEERQRRKGDKAVAEAAARQREILEEEQHAVDESKRNGAAGSRVAS